MQLEISLQNGNLIFQIHILGKNDDEDTIMTFITGLTVQKLGSISPSSLVKVASTIKLNHIEFDATIFEDLGNVMDVIKTKQTAIHAPYIEDYGVDLSSRKDVIDEFILNITQNKSKLNVIGVVVHPPMDAGGSIDLFYDRIEQIPLPLLENMPYQTWDEYLTFVEDTKAQVNCKLGMCFDIPHSFIQNGSEFLNLPDYCMSLLKSPEGYIHLSGGSRYEDTHFPLLTEGDLPIKQVSSFLKEIQFHGTITLELAPRNLQEIDKIFRSLSIMYNIAGKRKQNIQLRLKRPFIMRKIRSLSNYSDTEPFRRH